MLRYLLFSLLAIFLPSGLPSQTPEMDSLFTALALHRTAGDQTEECIVLRQISGLVYASGDYARAMAYSDSALAVLPPGRPDLEHHLNFIQYSIAAQQWYAYPEEHLTLLDTAYQYLVKLEDPELEIPYLNYYAFQLSSYGHQELAQAYLQRVVFLAGDDPDKYAQELLNCYSRQMDLYNNVGDYAEATRVFRAFRKLWRDRPPNRSTVFLWKDYAVVLGETGEQREVRRAMQQALTDAYAIQDSAAVVVTLNSCASYYLRVGELDTVPRLLEQARAYLDPVSNPGGWVSVRQNYATYYHARGMFERAIKELDPLAQFCQPLSAPANCKYVYYEMARNLDTLKRYDEMPPVLESSLEQARRSGDTRLASLTHWMLARVAQARSRPEVAIDHFLDYKVLQDSIYSEDLQKAVAKQRALQGVEEERAGRDRAELETRLARAQSRIFQLLTIALGGLLLVGGYLLWLLQRARARLRTNNEHLAELNATKDKFFGLIAHDLRGPIVALQGVGEQVDFYLQRDRPAKIQAVATNISTTANSLGQLLDQLLQWALLQTGMVPYEPTEVIVAEIFADNLSLYREMADSKGITLTAEAPPGLSVTADYRAVSTIIRNLLSNALKFTDGGGQVTLQAEARKGRALISVRDTGQGMSVHQLQELFTLTRHSRPGTSGETGSGLGLQLVRELTELNHGTVEVDSTVGEGTVFRVWLPVVD